MGRSVVGTYVKAGMLEFLSEEIGTTKERNEGKGRRKGLKERSEGMEGRKEMEERNGRKGTVCGCLRFVIIRSEWLQGVRDG